MVSGEESTILAGLGYPVESEMPVCVTEGDGEPEM